MKSFYVLLFALSGAFMSFGEGTPNHTTGAAVIQSELGFKLFYRCNAVGDVRVKISDTRGRVVFRETIRGVHQFMRPYDLSFLPSGRYTVSVDGPSGSKSQILDRVRHQPPKNLGLVRLAGEGNRYILTVPGKGEGTLHINIYDKLHRLIYRETENVSGDFAKIYALKGVQSNFTIEVSDLRGRRQSVSYRGQ